MKVEYATCVIKLKMNAECATCVIKSLTEMFIIFKHSYHFENITSRKYFYIRSKISKIGPIKIRFCILWYFCILYFWMWRKKLKNILSKILELDCPENVKNDVEWLIIMSLEIYIIWWSQVSQKKSGPKNIFLSH